MLAVACWLLLQYVTVTKIMHCVPSVDQKPRKDRQSWREATGVEDRCGAAILNSGLCFAPPPTLLLAITFSKPPLSH